MKMLTPLLLATLAATPAHLPALPVAAPRQDIVDDGFTWFEAHNTSTLDEKQAPVSTGWALKSWLRILGEYPGRSAIKLVLSKGGKPVGTSRCETDQYHKGPNDIDESFMITVECWRGNTATKDQGRFEVQVFTVNGSTDEEKLVRTYTIEVRRVERVRGSTTNPEPDAPLYYVSRHGEAAVAFLHMRPVGYADYLDAGSSPERAGANKVEVQFSLSPADTGKFIPHGYARCSVDGKRLSMPGPMPYADQALGTSKRQFEVIHTDRLAAKYKTGSPYADDIGFRAIRVSLPLTWGKVRDPNRLALEDYPGAWECAFMHDGVVWRTFRWTVGKDGRPPLHAEQQGNVALKFNSYLIDMEIPAGGTVLDKRLVPEAAAAGLFYGQPWTSAEGKAMAAKVPRKGVPWPVPSTQR